MVRGYILVDVLNLNTGASVLDSIGDLTPRRSVAGRLDFNIGSNKKRRALSSSIIDTPLVVNDRCSNPPCPASDCSGSVYPLGDANKDCVFDSIDVLAVLHRSSDSTTPTQAELDVIDADKNGRITPFDSEILLKARMGYFPLIRDITVLGIDGVGSDCHLTINVTLEWGSNGEILSGGDYSNTFAIFCHIPSRQGVSKPNSIQTVSVSEQN